ncbi:MAG: hypothetical protein GX806_04395 [Lentisphaerae bacterium]|nr:hypothetical protein [Lentisphaerota bacterium]
MKQTPSLIMKCCLCGRENTEQGWQYRRAAVEASIFYSHGFCTQCYALEIQKIRLQGQLTALAACH